MLLVDLTNDPMVQQFISDPDSLLKINQAKLSEELSMQPSLYARAAYLYAQARQYTNICKMTMEIKHSEIFKRHRGDSNAEKTSDTYAKGDDEYKKKRQLYIDAEHQEMMLRALMDGLQQKKDMLQTMGGILRQEMQTGIRIMEDQVREVMSRGGGGSSY